MFAYWDWIEGRPAIHCTVNRLGHLVNIFKKERKFKMAIEIDSG
jgi:hypothetical protein